MYRIKFFLKIITVSGSASVSAFLLLKATAACKAANWIAFYNEQLTSKALRYGTC